MKDYYQILGATPLDPKEKIQEHYRSISKNFRNMSEQDQRATIKALNNLIDEDKRKEYDEQPQFSIKKSSARLATATVKKKETEKVPFRWGVPIMEILLMPFKGEKYNNATQEPGTEEKANIHFTQGVLMAEDPKMLGQARTEFEAVISLMPDLKEGIYNLGIVLYRMGRFREAVAKFKECLQLDQRDPFAKKMISLLE